MIFGKASNKVKSLTYSQSDLDLKVLDYLIKNNLPIAYSCKSNGVCKKCVINEEVLSCGISLKDFLKMYGNTIEVSYL